MEEESRFSVSVDFERMRRKREQPVSSVPAIRDIYVFLQVQAQGQVRGGHEAELGVVGQAELDESGYISLPRVLPLLG